MVSFKDMSICIDRVLAEMHIEMAFIINILKKKINSTEITKLVFLKNHSIRNDKYLNI